MLKHAKLSPSGMFRALKCPGCINACDGIPRKPSSKYAMEGSIAHFLGERCLKRNEAAEAYFGNWGWDNGAGENGIQVSYPTNTDSLRLIQKIDDDMCEAVQVYLDEVRCARKAVTGSTFHIEQRLDISWLVPGMFGTGDHVIVEPLGCTYVHDYKHGKGVAVEAIGNTQARIYGLGALGEDNPNAVEEIENVIVQPRAPHPDGRTRRERMDVEDLYAWGYEVLKPFRVNKLFDLVKHDLPYKNFAILIFIVLRL